MSAIGAHASAANDCVSLWQQRRITAAQVWRDAQWARFDRVCNEEIQTLLKRNSQITQNLDVALTSALHLLDSV